MTDTLKIMENGVLRDASEDEIAAIEARNTEYEAGLLPAAIQQFQQERQARLSETDWWAIRASEPEGTPMTDAQLAYRAALRTMDDAEGFDPLNPVWPEAVI